MRKSLAVITFLLSWSVAFAAENPEKICFKDSCVDLEVASDEDSRARGLMFRKELPDRSGMLFVFPRDGLYAFWMKNTLIPLDMIWLDKDLNVVDIKTFVPPCRSPDCPSYLPQADARYVLEVNAGFAGLNAINLKDKARFQNDRP